jgi:hypothetical protein
MRFPFFKLPKMSFNVQSGPLRALWLSNRKPVVERQCIRLDMINRVQETLESHNIRDNIRFLVIYGEKGIGKSCLINSALQNTPGVIPINISPGLSAHKIIEKVVDDITQSKECYWYKTMYAKKAIFWFRLFNFGNSPIVYLNAMKPKNQLQRPAKIIDAAAYLVAEYGIRVIVEGQPEAFDEYLYFSRRSDIIEVQPMSKEVLRSVPQYRELRQIIKDKNLCCLVDEVFAGVPGKYTAMIKAIQHPDNSTIKDLVIKTLQGETKNSRPGHEDTKTSLESFNTTLSLTKDSQLPSQEEKQY